MAAPLTNSSHARGVESASAGEQIAVLTAELQQREQLIEVLTERLEEAAEQLDRFHRSGADRALRGGGGGGGGGASSEVLERLGGMAEGLELVVAEWQEVQAGAVLNRIDIRLEKLIDLLRGGDGGGMSEQPAQSNQGYSGGQSAPAPQHHEPQPQASAIPAEPQAEQPPIELKAAPTEVTDEEADPEKLRTAVRDREEYISYLIRELHRHQPRQPLDWAAIQACPDQLTETLKTLELRLQSELQREELNLSLERARMARERAELERIRGRLDKEIRALGRNQGATEARPAEEAASENSSSGLFKLFGRKR
jgi:hypothetical protein